MISVTTYKIAFWFLLTAVGTLSMVALQPMPQMLNWQDKLHHFLAYTGLCWILLAAYEKQQKIWKLTILLILFVGCIEFAQSYTGYRQADLMDLLANIAGILVAALLYRVRRGS